MKIVHDAAQEWSLQIECSSCKSTLEIVEEDVRYGQFGMAGHYDWELYVTCPVCDVDTQNFKVPSFVRRSADKRREKK